MCVLSFPFVFRLLLLFGFRLSVSFFFRRRLTAIESPYLLQLGGEDLSVVSCSDESNFPDAPLVGRLEERVMGGTEWGAE